MARNHYYKNHEHVISVLENQYGFKYTGLGDNSEECFHKDSSTPETIYIHPMFCSYYMANSRDIFARRFNEFECKSDYKKEDEQWSAFHSLLSHLDRFTVKNHSSKPVEIVPPTFPEAMLFNKHLWPLFREKYYAGKISLSTCLNALGLTAKDYEKMIKDDSG